MISEGMKLEIPTEEAEKSIWVGTFLRIAERMNLEIPTEEAEKGIWVGTFLRTTGKWQMIIPTVVADSSIILTARSVLVFVIPDISNTHFTKTYKCVNFLSQQESRTQMAHRRGCRRCPQRSLWLNK